MQAVRENRYVILTKDFEKGYKNNVKKDEQEHEFYKWAKPADTLSFLENITGLMTSLLLLCDTRQHSVWKFLPLVLLINHKTLLVPLITTYW